MSQAIPVWYFLLPRY